MLCLKESSSALVVVSPPCIWANNFLFTVAAIVQAKISYLSPKTIIICGSTFLKILSNLLIVLEMVFKI